jgi:hypothetical protein
MTRPLTALPLEVSRCGVWFNGDKEDLQAWRTCMMIRIPWDLVVHWIMGMRKWSQCFQTFRIPRVAQLQHAYEILLWLSSCDGW